MTLTKDILLQLSSGKNSDYEYKKHLSGIDKDSD